MSWLPQPTVTLAGQDYTDNTVGAASVSRGRDTVYASVQAGYATVELLDQGGMVQPVVGDRLVLSVENTGGTAIPVFTGQVSDWDAEVIAGTDNLIRFRVQAVGPLARLNRRTVLFAGRPSEDDGDRVLAALGAGLAQAWEELGPVAWEDVDPATSWDTFDAGFDPALIDPGVFTLSALDPADGGYNALRVAQEAAQSGDGTLVERPDGLIAYEDSDRRLTAATTDQFLPVPFQQVSAGGISVSQQFADLTNRVTVEFEGGAVTESDTDSIEQQGEVLASSFTTILVNQSNAEQRADRFLERHAAPTRNLGRLTVNLRGATATVRDLLLTANTGTPIVITDLPAPLGFTQFAGFVEGIELSFDTHRAELALLISAESLSTGPVRWSVIPQTLTWDDIDPALEWQDARSI